MTTRPERRERPSREAEASEVSLTGDLKIVPRSTLQHPKAVLPAYAVFVMRRDQRWHRQIFVSLHSAQRAIDRAAERGVEARCQLVEIVPVPSVPMLVVQGGGADE